MYRSLLVKLVLLNSVFFLSGCSQRSDKDTNSRGYRSGGVWFFGWGGGAGRSAGGSSGIRSGGGVSRGGFGRSGGISGG